MVSAVLFFLLLCSGGSMAAAFWGKRFEETLPVTCALIVLVLYVCGLFGALALGAVLVCVLGVGAYIAAAVKLCRKREWKKCVSVYITPAFILFTLLYAYLVYIHYGQLAIYRDEFSHWMYIVKAMTSLDGFGVDPMAHAAFASYPPGMALFQYMFQKLYLWTGHAGMSEWGCYMAYDVLMFAVVWPFARVLEIRKPICLLTSCGLILLCPLVFFPLLMKSTLIDPFLGFLFGAGLAMIFLQKRWDILSSLQVFSICALLVLAKDAGMLFAVFIAGGYILTLWLCAGGQENTDSPRKKLTYSLLALTAVAGPWVSWKWLLRAKNVTPAFSAPYDLGKILEVIAGRDTSPRAGIWRDFFSAFATRPVSLGYLGISLSFLWILVILAGAVLLLTAVLVKKELMTGRRALIALPLIAAAMCAYILGLCFTYIVRFSDGEALRLAEFSRYMGVAGLGGLCLAVILTVTVLPVLRFRRTAALLALAVMLCISPFKLPYGWLWQNNVYYSRLERDVLSPLARTVEECTPEDARIWFIDQGFEAHYCWMMRFDVYPRELPYDQNWSIGQPETEEDKWSAPITAQQWQERLMASYDYVVLFRLNDYFLDNYACLFAYPEEIAENAVYRVNRDTGLLEKCSA